MTTDLRDYKFEKELLTRSAPNKTRLQDLKTEEMILNMGPQHPSTHGVLRLELVTDGEIVVEVIPHLGYLHRCFEKHAEALTYDQVIPYVDRMDYLAAMNSEHAYAMGVERMMGIDKNIPKRVEYIRVLVSELNRLGSHFIAIGTYGIDIGAFTPFLWLFRDREHIMNLLEWASGARMLYNYVWIGGLLYDLPVGFEQRTRDFINYLEPKLEELYKLLLENKIFVMRAANVGVLPLDLAINYGCSGPVLRGSGLKWDLRRIDNYSVYPELEFDVPVGKGEMGKVGDCWDRNWVRMQECYESVKIIKQCIEKLEGEHKRTPVFDPREFIPKKLIPSAMEYYVRAENPRGELGFYFKSDGKKDKPFRCKARSGCFINLSVVPEISRGCMIADLIAILGSVDIVLGEVDR
ncbi:MAG: NADH dehydrogenase [Bacteroidetes bacterium RIFCSPLOWO2_02_FULL_36_8]|nr:MAG: NADH dehydrogenase [Bacteroidetes bacterium RIFCSPLOWO2_02_FULL_36_8]OFY69648.1 MAG: NADH dehydrogenase [Bacteroidetes bacterium RIFCSPLOWO2_12_FULL_37_12]